MTLCGHHKWKALPTASSPNLNVCILNVSPVVGSLYYTIMCLLLSKKFFFCGKRTRKALLKNYSNTLYSSIILLALPFSLKVRNIQYTYELTLSFLKTWDQHFTSCSLHKNLSIGDSVISWFVYVIEPLCFLKIIQEEITFNSGRYIMSFGNKLLFLRCVSSIWGLTCLHMF